MAFRNGLPDGSVFNTGWNVESGKRCRYNMELHGTFAASGRVREE